MSEKEKMPSAWKIIEDTERGPLGWGTLNSEEELIKFMKYMVVNCSPDMLNRFRVREIFLDFEDNDFMSYAAFLGLGDGKGVKA